VPGTGQIYRFIPLYPTTSNGYIGRNETSLLHRIQGHKTPKSECKWLSNAIKKHGLDQFAIVVLEGSIPVSQLANAEAKYVAQYDTYHNGYNCTLGSEAPPLLVPEIAAKVKATKNTAASRAKTVAASRRHWDDPVTHAQHAASLAKSRRDQKVRKKASAAATAMWQRNGFKERFSCIQKVAQNTPRRRKQTSDQMTTLWSNSEYKINRSKKNKEGITRAKAARVRARSILT
jgi:group I intron endonuclease